MSDPSIKKPRPHINKKQDPNIYRKGNKIESTSHVKNFAPKAHKSIGYLIKNIENKIIKQKQAPTTAQETKSHRHTPPPQLEIKGFKAGKVKENIKKLEPPPEKMITEEDLKSVKETIKSTAMGSENPTSDRDYSEVGNGTTVQLKDGIEEDGGKRQETTETIMAWREEASHVTIGDLEIFMRGIANDQPSRTRTEPEAKPKRSPPLSPTQRNNALAVLNKCGNNWFKVIEKLDEMRGPPGTSMNKACDQMLFDIRQVQIDINDHTTLP